MTLFLLLILGVAVYFIFFADQSKTAVSSEKTALDMLKEKFINGEIDEEEYNRKKKVIEK
ncbi:MAG: SHOCT domain-containing protein [Eubacteriales bacterium]